MLCEKCGVNNAVTHIRTVVNGVVSEKHLCHLCALDEKYADSLSQILSSMLGDTDKELSDSKITRCSCCGNTFSDIADSGKCGCSECYTTFYEQLLPYLKRVHGSTKHIGKRPEHEIKEKNKSENIYQLQELLKKLVSEEKYEDAAVIRDKIKNMECEAQ